MHLPIPRLVACLLIVALLLNATAAAMDWKAGSEREVIGPFDLWEKDGEDEIAVTLREDAPGSLRVENREVWLRGPHLACLYAPLEVDFAPGDHGVLEVRANCDGQETAPVYFFIETVGGGEAKKIFERTVTVSDSAGLIRLPFRVATTIPEGTTGFRIGIFPFRAKCSFAFEDLQVFKLSPALIASEGFDFGSIRREGWAYDGQAPEAAWRAAAWERINKHRKADIRIRLVDSQGEPVPEIDVLVRQSSSAFPFGTAINTKYMMRPVVPEIDPATLGEEERAEYERKLRDNTRYRELIPQLFNMVVTENGLKHKLWEDDDNYRNEDTLAALRWLKEKDLTIRGHVMVWPSWKWAADEAKAVKDDPEALRQIVADHIDDVATATKGLVDEWDVLNEPNSEHDYMDLLGRDVMIDWFTRARSHLPGVPLYLNDYDLINNGTRSRFRKSFIEIAQYLLDGGAPLDGIGIQGHHFAYPPKDPENVYTALDEIAGLGLPMKITEYDYATFDENLQAEWQRDFYLLCFSHPQVNGILMWGFWDGRHWRKGAGLFKKDWTPREAADAYAQLILKDLLTNTRLTSDEDGVIKLRGFHGDYNMIAVNGAAAVSQSFSVGPQGTRLTVVVP